MSPISRVTLEELSLQAEPFQEALRRARHDEVVAVPLGVQTVNECWSVRIGTPEMHV